MTFSPMSGGADTVDSTTAVPGPAVGEERSSGVGPAIWLAHTGRAVGANSWPLRSYLELGALPSAVPCARLHAKQVLWEWKLDDLADPVELIVSELVTNGLQASTGMAESQYQGRWQPGARRCACRCARTAGASWCRCGTPTIRRQNAKCRTWSQPVAAG